MATRNTFLASLAGAIFLTGCSSLPDSRVSSEAPATPGFLKMQEELAVAGYVVAGVRYLKQLRLDLAASAFHSGVVIDPNRAWPIHGLKFLETLQASDTAARRTLLQDKLPEFIVGMLNFSWCAYFEEKNYATSLVYAEVYLALAEADAYNKVHFRHAEELRRLALSALGVAKRSPAEAEVFEMGAINRYIDFAVQDVEHPRQRFMFQAAP
jgi:hypothetical protein